MINFCEEIITQSCNPKKINFLFQSLIKSITRKDDLWEVKINHENFVTSKNLVFSSSLIAHPRCLGFLNINSLPLRDAIKKGKDETLDSLLRGSGIFGAVVATVKNTIIQHNIQKDKVVISGGEARLTSPKLIPTVPLAEVNIMMISTYQILTEDLSKICILPKHPSIIEPR